MFLLGFCVSKRGRALQLQAAATKGDCAEVANPFPEGMVASGVGAKPSDPDPAVAAAEAAGLVGTVEPEPM
eukprot:10697834-Lingulodinium_polyedra.AAC.1